MNASFSSSLPARLATLLLLLAPLGTACGGSDGADPTGGDDGGSCTGARPECCGTDAHGCSTLAGSATCTAAGWTCPSGDTLAGTGFGVCDSLCASSFACGSGGLTCDPTTQYCLLVHGEQQTADAGDGASCAELPTGCSSGERDAATACSCIGTADTCVDDDGAITVTAEAL